MYMIQNVYIMHMQALEDQFPCEKDYTITKEQHFRFKKSPYIKMVISSTYDKYNIGLEPSSAQVYSM